MSLSTDDAAGVSMPSPEVLEEKSGAFADPEYDEGFGAKSELVRE